MKSPAECSIEVVPFSPYHQTLRMIIFEQDFWITMRTGGGHLTKRDGQCAPKIRT